MQPAPAATVHVAQGSAFAALLSSLAASDGAAGAPLAAASCAGGGTARTGRPSRMCCCGDELGAGSSSTAALQPASIDSISFRSWALRPSTSCSSWVRWLSAPGLLTSKPAGSAALDSRSRASSAGVGPAGGGTLNGLSCNGGGGSSVAAAATARRRRLACFSCARLLDAGSCASVVPLAVPASAGWH